MHVGVSPVICTSQTITMAVPRAYQVISLIKMFFYFPFVDNFFSFLKVDAVDLDSECFQLFKSQYRQATTHIPVRRHRELFLKKNLNLLIVLFFLGWLFGKNRARNFCAFRCSCPCGMTHLLDCHN